MLKPVNVPVTVSIIHRLQAILRAEAMDCVGSDKNTVMALACSRATPDDPAPDCLDRLLWDACTGSQ